jgi:hypothetical protein
MNESVADAWRRCRPWLESAVRRQGECTIEDAESAIASGQAWFVPGDRCAAVLQMTRDTNVWLGGGDLSELVRRLPDIEAWAREQGCDRTTLIGRKGWERVLRPHGYRPIYMLAKDLT